MNIVHKLNGFYMLFQFKSLTHTVTLNCHFYGKVFRNAKTPRITESQADTHEDLGKRPISNISVRVPSLVVVSSGLSRTRSVCVSVWPSCTEKLSVRSQTWQMGGILLHVSATPLDTPAWSCHVRATTL